jgi:hypothetical protein
VPTESYKGKEQTTMQVKTNQFECKNIMDGWFQHEVHLFRRKQTRDCVWDYHVDRAGKTWRPFYVNRETQETRWDLPLVDYIYQDSSSLSQGKKQALVWKSKRQVAALLDDIKRHNPDPEENPSVVGNREECMRLYEGWCTSCFDGRQLFSKEKLSPNLNPSMIDCTVHQHQHSFAVPQLPQEEAPDEQSGSGARLRNTDPRRRGQAEKRRRPTASEDEEWCFIVKFVKVVDEVSKLQSSAIFLRSAIDGTLTSRGNARFSRREDREGQTVVYDRDTEQEIPPLEVWVGSQLRTFRFQWGYTCKLDESSQPNRSPVITVDTKIKVVNTCTLYDMIQEWRDEGIYACIDPGVPRMPTCHLPMDTHF